jgi:hypothetical protein
LSETRLTEEDLARDLTADLKLCEAATPGPWERRDTLIGQDKYHSSTEIVGAPVYAHGRRVGGASVCKLYAGFVWFEGDCVFVPASRDGWPAAIRRALAAEAERDALRKDACAVMAADVRAVFADGREPTTNERHLLNLLSWRERENAELRRRLAELEGKS